MKKLLLIPTVLIMTSGAFAETEAKAPVACKKEGYTRISCDEVKGAKRSGFCWKGVISDKRTAKICKKKPSKKLVKKTLKKKKKTTL